jgi:hypothetical protein
MWRVGSVLPSHLHIDAIQVDLEVDNSRGILYLSNELPALNVQTDEQPAEHAAPTIPGMRKVRLGMWG